MLQSYTYNNSLSSWMNSLSCSKVLHAFLDTSVIFFFLLLYFLCIAYLTCADENGYEFGERTELIKKLSGKLQNNRRTMQWFEPYQRTVHILFYFPNSIIAGLSITKIYLYKCNTTFQMSNQDLLQQKTIFFIPIFLDAHYSEAGTEVI